MCGYMYECVTAGKNVSLQVKVLNIFPLSGFSDYLNISRCD